MGKTLTCHETAEKLGITISTLRTWRRQGRLQPIRLSRKTLLYLARDVNRLLNTAATLS